MTEQKFSLEITRRLSMSLFICVCIIAMSTLFCLPTMAQADFEKGYQGYQSYHGSDFDNVNLANGNLILDIPLISYPQRGGLPPVVLSIKSNSTTFQSNPPFLNGPLDTKQHEVASGIIGAPWGQPHVVLTPGGLSWREERVSTASHTANGGPEYLTRFVAIDESGATHSLGGAIANKVSGAVTGIRYSVDGSGLMLQPGTTQAGPVLVDRKGNIGGMIDPDGNMIILAGPCARAAGSGDYFNPSLAEWEGYAHGTASAMYIIDSVGRKISNPAYLQPSSTYSCIVDIDASYHSPNANNCDSIPFPAQNNGTVNLTFCYSQISISQSIPTPLAVGTTVPNGGTGTSSPSNCFTVPPTNGEPVSCETINESWWVLSSVTLPNSTQWLFTYNSSGQVASVTMPTGASVSYTYGTRIACGNPPGQIPVSGTPTWPYSNLLSSQMVTSRTVNMNDGTAPYRWTYNYNIGSGWAGSPNDGSVTVTGPAAASDPNAPEGSDTVHIFSLVGGSTCGPYETQTQVYEGLASANNELKQIDTRYGSTGTDYANPTNFSNYIAIGVLPKTVTTTLYGGSQPVVSQETSVYDSFGTYEDYTGASHPFSFGQVLSSTQSDWSNGSVQAMPALSPPPALPAVPNLVPLRTILHTNEWQSNWQYYAHNLIDLPCLDTTFAGASSVIQTSCASSSTTQASQTAYSYDEAAYLPSGTASGSMLGNLTSVNRWLQSPGSPLATVSTHTFYTPYGMPSEKLDANGNATKFMYDPSNLFVDQIAYPVTITNGTAVSHIENPGYDLNTGLLNQNTDENSRTTYYTYDSMRRLLTVAYPDTGSETYTYFDNTDYASNPVYHSYFTFTKKLNASQTYTATGFADALGRMALTQVTSAPEGLIAKATTYDTLGRIQSVSNPYISTVNGLVSYQYDAMGRKLYQCQQDNIQPNPAACAPSNSYLHWLYQGNVTVSFDELQHRWSRTTDGLGRLTSVVEPGSLNTSSSYLNTTYSYDVLNNLLCADQWGATSPGTACTGAVHRIFSYDSLSRLLTSANPETGTICYGQVSGSNCVNGYDPNGNLIYKTNARGIVTGYTYDALNRLLAKAYNNDTSGTPSSCYQYDLSTLASNSANSSTGTNLIGRLTNAWTQKASCPSSSATPALPSGALSLRSVQQYDQMGRVNSELQCTKSNCTASTQYGVTYLYDQAGNLVLHTNGLSSSNAHVMTFSNCYDTANRLALVVNGSAPCPNPTYTSTQSLFSSPTYSTFGDLAGATFGTGLQMNRTFDVRLRVTGETDTGNTAQTTTPGATIQIIGNTDQVK